MLGFMFLLLALGHVALFLWSLRRPLTGFPVWYLRCLLLAMALDNVMIAVAPALVDSSTYAELSVLRFWLHAIVLPGLLVFVASILCEYLTVAGLRRVLLWGAWLLTIAAVTYGYLYELANLNLVRAEFYPRMVSSDGQLPYATILVNLLVIVAGIWVWRRAGWPWLFLGAVQIFVVNGAAAGQEWGFIAGNLAELFFVASLLATLNQAIESQRSGSLQHQKTTVVSESPMSGH